MEVKLIFKNVGQGDTIILQTEIEGHYKIGIIDCKMTRIGFNPDKEAKKQNIVVEYLKNMDKNYYSIEFVALSHPHKDHCDGLASLFAFFNEEEIKVKTLYHTFTLMTAVQCIIPESFGKQYNQFIKSLSDYKEVFKGKGEMSAPLHLMYDANGIIITCFSPSPDENAFCICKLLSEAINNKGVKLVSKTNTFSNYKSTILKIDFVAAKKSILLTSDSEGESFQRINDDYLKERTPFWDSSYKFIAAQIPHHGSYDNFYDSFWTNLKSHSPDTEIIISVGKNIYNHPNKDVLDKLKKIGFGKIKMTGKVETDKNYKLHHDLDYISSLSYNLNNDITITQTLTKK